jgi:hypothetical protein
MSGLGLRKLRKRNRRPDRIVVPGEFVVHGFRGEPLRGDRVESDSPAAVDRYRLRQEHEADVVAFVLAGLNVGSLGELHRLVEAGRASEVAP